MCVGTLISITVHGPRGGSGEGQYGGVGLQVCVWATPSRHIIDTICGKVYVVCAHKQTNETATHLYNLLHAGGAADTRQTDTVGGTDSLVIVLEEFNKGNLGPVLSKYKVY